MMWFSLFLSLSFFSFVLASQQYYHDAIATLSLLLKADEEIVKILQKYLQRAKSKNITEIVRRYINTSRRFTEVVASGSDPFHHPINGFHFLKHQVYSWKHVDSALKNDSTFSSGPLVRAIMRKKDTDEHPTPKDVSYAAASISRMQYIYNLPMKGLVQGKVNNGAKGEVFESIEALNSWDCNEIGQGAMVLDQYQSAKEWFNIAKDQVVRGDDSIDVEIVLKNEREANKKFELSVSSAKEAMEVDIDEIAKTMDNPSFTQYTLKNSKRTHESMAALCRGEAIKLKVQKPNLSCKYFTRDHAFFKLGPLKLEEVSEKPALMLFHNFMMEEEMKKLVEISERNLQTSKHHGKSKELNPLVLSCTSKQYQITPSNAKQIYAKISYRVEAALGVQIKQGPVQVKNYGIAGAYTSHVDFKFGVNRELEEKIRHFVANLMTYAGNVTYGGSTVFPLTGVSVPPERGSALLWFNNYKNGEGDDLSMHSSCPIVYGSKWIINNWIDKEDQMFSFPCGPNYQDRFQLFR